MRISPTKSTFFLGKNFDDTRHSYEKNKPTLDHFEGGGGVHGKTGWLIGYEVCSINLLITQVFVRAMVRPGPVLLCARRDTELAY